MNNELVDTIVSFTKLLNQATSNAVKDWDLEFIQTSVDWCIFLETELSLLQPQECKELQNKAHDQSGYSVPPIETLLDAPHEFYKGLLENVYLGNDLYLYILKNYRFLTVPEKSDLLLEDLAALSKKSATANILQDLLHELQSIT